MFLSTPSSDFLKVTAMTERPILQTMDDFKALCHEQYTEFLAREYQCDIKEARRMVAQRFFPNGSLHLREWPTGLFLHSALDDSEKELVWSAGVSLRFKQDALQNALTLYQLLDAMSQVWEKETMQEHVDNSPVSDFFKNTVRQVLADVPEEAALLNPTIHADLTSLKKMVDYEGAEVIVLFKHFEDRPQMNSAALALYKSNENDEGAAVRMAFVRLAVLRVLADCDAFSVSFPQK